MAATVATHLTPLALAAAEGLLRPDQKQMPATYLYDDLGSALFDAITLLPEYGLTRADERLLRLRSSEIAAAVGTVSCVAELGSGTGKKTRHILQSFVSEDVNLVYRPIDVSALALASCARELADIAEVLPLQATWMEGLRSLAEARASDAPMFLLFLGSSIGNLSRAEIPEFLRSVRAFLRPGDFFLLGLDLVKPISQMLLAYDDPTGVTAAFNLNLLGRLNRELDAGFNLRKFAHRARWNPEAQRIEMHLESLCRQHVFIKRLEATVDFCAGESIWTESSHKFTVDELPAFADAAGFAPAATWIDDEWPFAEALWRVRS